MIPSRTKGITCISSEEDFPISQRNKRVWIMVSKGKDISLISYIDADWAGCIDDQ
jgi:hypothetical protein